MAIVDANGKPFEVKMLAEPQTARIAGIHNTYDTHPARGLTPQRMSRILEDAEHGNLAAQADLFADMEERDGHILAEMGKRKQAILTLPITVEPPDNASTEEKSDAAWLSEILKSLPGFSQMLVAMMEGVGYGYSNIEMTWEYAEKTWLVSKFEHRKASWFTLSQEDQNAMLLRNMGLGEPLQPFTWIQHVHRAKSGHIARCGLHRALAWPYLFKSYSVSDLAELLEIYGLPIRLGKYPAGTGAKEKAALLRAVTELGHSAAGIIPEGMAIEFQTAASGNHDPYMAVINWSELTASKVILGGTLTSQADGKTSTNALGKIHNECRHDLKAADALHVEETLARDLTYPLMVLNKGRVNPRRMPRIKFNTSQAEDITKFAQALPPLVDIGFDIPLEWAQKQLGIPLSAKGQAVLRRTSVQPATAGFAHLFARQTQPTLTPVEQMAARLASDAGGAWQQVLGHVASLVQNAESMEGLQAQLLACYSSLPMDDLTAVMAQALQVAELAGIYTVQTGQ